LDPLGKRRPARGKDRSGRSQGAQPGHEGHGRELLPPRAVDELVEYWPERCECGHVFAAVELLGVGKPVRHQVEELPVISARVIEHRCPRVRCPGCGEWTRAPLPADVASSAFGPRFEAAVAVLSVRNRVSRRDVVELGEELFGVRLCAGTVEAILQRTGQALAEPYQHLGERVRASESMNMDETGWRTRRAAPRIVGHVHRPPRVLSPRPGPSRGSRQTAARGSRGDRDLRPLVGLQPSALGTPPALLVTPTARLHRSRRRAGGRERVRRGGSRSVRARVLGVGDLPAHPGPARAQAHNPPAATPV